MVFSRDFSSRTRLRQGLLNQIFQGEKWFGSAWTSAMKLQFPIHVRPNISILEPHIEEIKAMRKSLWPYWKIAEWLKAERDIIISREGVRQFCIVRDIQKGRSSTIRPQQQRRHSQRTAKGRVKDTEQKPRFEYDASGPIERNWD